MRRFILLLAAVLMFAGCAEYRQISVDNVSLAGFRFHGTSSATIEIQAEVENPTAHAISVQNVDAVLLRNGREFARFSLEEVPVAAPDTLSVVTVPLRATVSDPISIITAGLDFSSWDLDDFTVNGKITVRSDAGYKKTFRMKKTPARDLLKMIKL